MSFDTQSQSRTMPQRTMPQRTMPQEKQQIAIPPIPPMQYDLKSHTCDQINLFIKQQIEWGAYPTPDAIQKVTTFLQTIDQKYKKREFTLTYGYIPAPPHSQVTRRVIGKDGYFFKMTTALSGVEFIWHDRVTNMFLFWGSSVFKVVRAMNSIRWRIHKCYAMPPSIPNRVEYISVEDISDDDDAVPDLIDADGNIVN